ncbi:MAG: DUF504 domain-containing protein [Alphaproteobacteria bacterium]|nr:DUF504 domain-containing protein [Alphaproteobacteria bacterium]
MRTSERAFHQIRWDPRLSPERFVVGVDVHAREPKRVPLPDFVPGGDIPWHRVLFIELDGVRVWDRESGADTIDALAAEGLARPRPLSGGKWRLRAPVAWDGEWAPEGGRFATPPAGPLRLVTWNALWDRFESDRIASAARWPLLLDALLDAAPDLVALQEVDPALHDLILADPRIREGFWVSHGPGHADVGRFDLLWLGRVPVHQVASWELGPHKNVLACAFDGGVALNVHLTSDHSEKAAHTRAAQVAAVRELVARTAGALVLCGDFNHASEDPLFPLDDAWLAIHDQPVPTFDPTVNPLAALQSLTGRPARLDRVLLRDLHAHDAALLGTSPEGELWLSDHAGVAVALSSQPPENVHTGEPSVRSALAWVPAEADAVQAVRAEHDPGFVRWPPHINVLWGFVEESALDAARGPLEHAVRGELPFDARLDRIHTFRHHKTASHGLVPADTAPWQALHRRLRRHFPRCGRPELLPHLTFARSEPHGAPPEVSALEGAVHDLVVLTRRADEPFAPRARLPLGGPVLLEPEPVWPPGEPTDAGPLARLPGAVVVGSRQLGAAIDGSDLDLVFPDADPDGVRALLEPHVDALVPVVKAGLPGFRAWRGDLVIDAQPALDDPRAASSIADGNAVLDAVQGRVDAFRGLLRHVKGWARAQSLDDAAWGGLEGLAWAVLVARVVREAPAGADLVRTFFATWAAHDWSRAVSLGDVEGAVPAFAVLTPTAPVRNIAERLQVARFEDALLEAWESLDAGASVEDLWRPLPFHRRFPFAVHVRAATREAAGHARGRARALLELVGGVPCPGMHHVVGVPRVDGPLLEAVEAWAEPLPGVEVEVVRTDRVPTPGRGGTIGP